MFAEAGDESAPRADLAFADYWHETPHESRDPSPLPEEDIFVSPAQSVRAHNVHFPMLPPGHADKMLVRRAPTPAPRNIVPGHGATPDTPKDHDQSLQPPRQQSAMRARPLKKPVMRVYAHPWGLLVSGLLNPPTGTKILSLIHI